MHLPSEPLPSRGPVSWFTFGLMKFTGWWVGMAGLLAMFSTCPCCGRPGCPAGAAGLGVMGAALMMLWKPIRALRSRLPGGPRRSEPSSDDSAT